MKFMIVLAAVVAVAVAGHLDSGSVHVSQDTLGNYNLGYDIGSIARTESRDAHDGSVHGSYSYIAPDGIRRSFAYTSGINGYQVTGSHLPVPVLEAPEVAIARNNHYLALQRGGAIIPVHHQPHYIVHPLPVQETPEVAAARAEHLRLHALARGHFGF